MARTDTRYIVIPTALKVDAAPITLNNDGGNSAENGGRGHLDNTYKKYRVPGVTP